MKANLESADFYMGLAIEEAIKGSGLGEVPVGAVVVGSDGGVMARAHNMPILSNDPTAHAEVLAIRGASATIRNYRLAGCDLYVTLEPCAMCVGAMLHARIRRLFFGAADTKSGAAGSVVDLTKVASLNHHVEVIGGVLGQECGDLLRSFFRERRS
ncbi:MAG: tRNA adenosine(34) deaminase TadA [Syntrophobacteraceae bacterium]